MKEMKTHDGQVFEFDKPLWLIEELGGDLRLKHLPRGFDSDFWKLVEFPSSAGVALENFAGGMLISDDIFFDEIEGLRVLRLKLRGTVNIIQSQIDDIDRRIIESEEKTV